MMEWQWEPLDWQLADLLAESEQNDARLLRQSVRMLSHQMRGGDTCLYLPDFAGQALDNHERLPGLADWVAQLAACESVGDEHRPLVLDRDQAGAERLYFQRYWQYEQRLAERLTSLAKTRPDMPTDAWLDEQLGKLPLARRQAQAVRRAFAHGLCVISGGPGTGKTTTVSALVMLLQAWRPDIRISMAAPTGKAAARMQESVRGAAGFLGLQDQDQDLLAHEAMTLHRLLGFQYGKVGFRHHAGNPLNADVVIVDEASMIDLALMSRLLEAVRPDARLVLLGDKDQLASVEAGEVMATLCADDAGNPLRENVVVLDQVHRYAEETGISQLAQAVNGGDEQRATDILLSTDHDDVRLLSPAGMSWQGYLRGKLFERMDDGGPDSLKRFQVLCALRNGPSGVSGMNQWMEHQLAQAGRIPPRFTWYAGRPVIVTRNSPGLKLYNGDIGLTVRRAGQLRVSFPTIASAAQDGQRDLSTARLPAHETAWALTVHKSQGSEFDEVMLILPAEMSPLLTRELIYTAITRARSRLTVVGDAELLRQAISNRVQRHSGLAGRLKRLSPDWK